ncbi:MAG: DUF3617 domain-containing protein [Burkholderiaceae bacterium]
MKKKSLARGVVGAAAALFAAFAPALANAEPLYVKPGAWEFTVSTTTTVNAITPKELAKLPPYRRSMIEKSMAGRSGKPNTSVQKICVKKEDLDRDRFPPGDDADCTRQNIVRTLKKMVVATSCSGVPRTGTITFEAKTPESLAGTIDQPTSNGKFHADINGRWLGPICVGIPDKLAKMR